MYFEVHHTCEAEANKPTANNCCSVAWGRLSTHGEPGYIGNCDIHIENMVTIVVLEVKYISASCAYSDSVVQLAELWGQDEHVVEVGVTQYTFSAEQ